MEQTGWTHQAITWLIGTNPVAFPPVPNSSSDVRTVQEQTTFFVLLSLFDDRPQISKWSLKLILFFLYHCVLRTAELAWTKIPVEMEEIAFGTVVQRFPYAQLINHSPLSLFLIKES